MPRKSRLLTFVPDEPSLTPRKRINSNAKGRRNERKTHKWLEKRGYVVHTTTRGSHRGNDNDIFNLFDHIAIAKGLFQLKMAFIQTKSNGLGDAVKKIRTFQKDTVTLTEAQFFVFRWDDHAKEPQVYWIRPVEFQRLVKSWTPVECDDTFGKAIDED